MLNEQLIRALSELNRRFYVKHAQSFSETRQGSWPGWERCLSFVQACNDNSRNPYASKQVCHVLDLACGNLRFERFLTHALPETRFLFRAVDSCAPLAKDFALASLEASRKPSESEKTAEISFLQCDLIEELLQATAVNRTNCYDLAVCFGFMHHVPSSALRSRLLSSMLDQVRPKGFVIVSFWEFMEDLRMARKAYATHERAMEEFAAGTFGQTGLTIARGSVKKRTASLRNDTPAPGETHDSAGCEEHSNADKLAFDMLEPGDFILGWQDNPHAYRYCHSFTTAEIDSLLKPLHEQARMVSRFHADGRNGQLNEYAVLQALA